MAVREVRKKSPTPILKCVVCGVTQVLIGAREDWMPAAGGHVCHKAGCRAALGLPKYVPPDERR